MHYTTFPDWLCVNDVFSDLPISYKSHLATSYNKQRTTLDPSKFRKGFDPSRIFLPPIVSSGGLGRQRVVVVLPMNLDEL